MSNLPTSDPPNRAFETGQRADKWLWHARLVKTRTLAAGLIETGRVRVNRVKIQKPAHRLNPGDVLTFFHAGRVHTVEVLAFADRRGPANLARLLYRSLGDDTQPHSRRDDQLGDA